jgi:3-methyladenine DNA glycosylase/8-oxoguanine DNA glycosylase
MFLMNALHRPDVWPMGDLGVRNGYALAHGMDEMPTPRVLDGLGERLRPYRSIAAWWCWREVELSRS